MTPLEDEWHEEIVQMNVANYVGVESLIEVASETAWILTED
jgi:hypothetical protein